MAFARFMSQPIGWIIRAAFGLVLIALGSFVIGGTVGIVVGVINLALLAAGVLNFCVVAPLVGATSTDARTWKAGHPGSTEGRFSTEAVSS